MGNPSGQLLRFGQVIQVVRESHVVALMCLLVFLSSCVAIAPVQFKGPNGKTAYSMRCSGMGRTIEDCYQKAGEVCPDGYTILDRDSSLVGAPMGGGMYITTKRGMAIECK